MKMLNYENSVFPYSLHFTVNLPAWMPKDKCYFNVVSPSIHWDSDSRKKKIFFSKLHEKCCQNLKNPWGIANIPFCDAITKPRIFLFVNFLLKYELVSRIRNFMKRNKKYTQFFLYLRFKITFTRNFFINF